MRTCSDAVLDVHQVSSSTMVRIMKVIRQSRQRNGTDSGEKLLLCYGHMHADDCLCCVVYAAISAEGFMLCGMREHLTVQC